MGSRHYADEARARADRIVAMLSIESIGYYNSEPGSQRYPFPLNLLYPDLGDFIGFVSNLRSGPLVRRAIARFRSAVQFPTEGAAVPSWVPGVWWSDHWSFWRQGYQAIMITDTAPFRNPFYHTPQDTPDKLDYGRIARVVDGLEAVVSDLAGR
jgi:Zn-dependent M28 family amino/carboxypeptidase